MFASTILSRLTNSTSQPLLPIASPRPPIAMPPYIDPLPPSTTDASATLAALARQEAHLQSHIQYLLDIQSDRLLEDLGGSPSSRPPQNRIGNARRRSSRGEDEDEEEEQPPSLQTARASLTTAISSLASLKSQTFSLLASALASTSTSLSAITTLQSRKSALVSKIGELETSPASSELDGLAREEEALGQEIYELESRLFEMKAKRRALRLRIEEGRNREEARVSSWRRSLELLEGEEGEVLRRGREGVVLGGAAGKKGEGAEGVWDLPAKRRTLSMVRDYYAAEQERLGVRLEGVEREREALEEGGGMWEEVVEAVEGVEGLLVDEMNRMGEDGGGGRERGGMEKVLRAMGEARRKIEGAVRVAEEKGWRLLVVAVGAELEALVEGEGLLRGVLGLGNERGGEGEGVGGAPDGREDTKQRLEEERGLGDSILRRDNRMVEETDDDEPGPDLLMSTQDEEIGQLRI
ncbi:MAG: hypothetical protein Q9208_006039 [Pyrenodesmia sp. 3 TL-2023]